jgi:hypothetical protein
MTGKAGTREASQTSSAAAAKAATTIVATTRRIGGILGARPRGNNPAPRYDPALPPFTLGARA